MLLFTSYLNFSQTCCYIGNKFKEEYYELYRFHRKRDDIIFGKEGRYEKIILISSLVLAVGLGVGCSNEKAKRLMNRKKAVQKEKELTAKDVFNKANEAFKNEENVTMTYDVGIKAEGTEMNVIKAKMQLEPKKKILVLK